MFNMPRAAINFNDHLGGGNVVSGNLIWNTCRESGDHGPINTWDRMPFLADTRGSPSFEPLPTWIRDNYIVANYGASQGVDNDDGSSWYHISNNVFYSADGLKMDYGGHDSKFFQNLVVVYPYDGGNCIGVGDFKAGHAHAYFENVCISGVQRWRQSSGCGTPRCAGLSWHTRRSGSPPVDMDTVGHVGQCDIAQLFSNTYYTPNGNASLVCAGEPLPIPAVQSKFGAEMGSSFGRLPEPDVIVQWTAAKIHGWRSVREVPVVI